MPAHMTDREIVFASGDTFVARLHGVRRFGSAGSADIGFISGGNYVLFSNDCDVLLTALRYAINKDSEDPADWNDGTIEENTKDMSTYYRCIILAGPSEKGQELQAKVNAGEELTWDDLNSATWSVLSPTSASGYIYPCLWLQS